MKYKSIIIYSHGFGVQKTDRGLFTDIADTFPDIEHIMFDYNQVDEQDNSLTVAPFYVQKQKLADAISNVRASNPGATIDLITHSQGCVIAALLNPDGIRRSIFTAPPSEVSTEGMLKAFGQREGAKVDINGLTSFPRRDGSTTIVPPEYWQSIKDVHAVELYNQFAKITELTIVNANQDEVLQVKDFSELKDNVKVVDLDANHDFTGEYRPALIQAIVEEIQQ